MDEWLDFVRRAADVNRFHIERTIHRNTVGQHSFNVAMLVLRLEPSASRELLMSALFHDLPERELGDVPAPTKWAHPELRNQLAEAEVAVSKKHGLWEVQSKLLPSERCVLKWADYLEAAYFCLEERRMGNTELTGPFSRLVTAMGRMDQHPVAVELLRQLVEESCHVR